MKTTLNVLGIICSSLGSVLVWHFLKQLSFVDHDAFLKGQGVLKIPVPSDDEVKKYKRAIALSNLGIVLIVLGGFFQLVSNYCSD